METPLSRITHVFVLHTFFVDKMLTNNNLITNAKKKKEKKSYL